MTIIQLHEDMGAKTRLCSHHYEESVTLPSQLSEDPLNLLTLVSSMPGLRHVLEIRLGQAVVAVVVAEEASQCYSITKLNSRLKLQRGPVDEVLDFHRFHGLRPSQELFR